MNVILTIIRDDNSCMTVWDISGISEYMISHEISEINEKL